LLGIAERTAKDIQGGRTTGASIAEITALEALGTLRRDRAAIIRAELAQLERHLNEGAALDRRVAGLGASR
jgi:hypothetical protein